MHIKPSASIRQNYNDIAELCRATGEPVYLTKNGEGDLVVMDIASFTKREKMLKLREELLAIEEDRLRGAPESLLSTVSRSVGRSLDPTADKMTESVPERRLFAAWSSERRRCV